jgi:hypothetical protein
MDAFFFRVEHDLLRSESFQSLSGSAIKVYLTIGLYSDFGTGWAYPSIRTIARQAGLSRQTVLTAIDELVGAGLLATNKVRGKSNAYKIIRQAPRRPAGRKGEAVGRRDATGPKSLGEGAPTGPLSLEVHPETGPESFEALARFFGPAGRAGRPEREPGTRGEDNSASIPIPGTPFRLTADGRLQVAVDLQNLLTDQGLPRQLAAKLATQKDPEAVAKVLLNALYLQSQGKLQNGPGYIRAGIEDGYELLPQVASRLEVRKRELQERLRSLATKQQQRREEQSRASEEEAIQMVLEQVGPDELQNLVEQAVAMLPSPLVRRNATLSNPFVRAKVYELAGGEPIDGTV